jgi:hypothetical protein
MESWHDAIVTASQRQKHVTDPGVHIGPEAGPTRGRLRMTVGHERSKPQKGCRGMSDGRCLLFCSLISHYRMGRLGSELSLQLRANICGSRSLS